MAGRPWSRFTEEQLDYADAVRAFCDGEVGSSNQLRELTGNGHELHNPALVTEVAKKIAVEGVQMMGGYGYAIECGMERHLRHSIAPTVYAGTNEIRHEIISSTIG